MQAKNQPINKKVKICIECGSFSTIKKDLGVYCNDCGKFFEIKGGQNE